MKRIINSSITIFIVSVCFLCCGFYVKYYDVKHETDERFRIIANLDTSIISGNTLITPVDNIQQKNIRKLFARFNVSELQAVYRNRFDRKGQIKPGIISSSTGTWQQIILNDNNKASRLVALLKKEKGVLNAYIEWLIPIKPCIAPNDPLYSSQWHLRSISYPAADINAEQAWDINRGRSDVIIAVCDGGVDYTHPDMDPGDRSRVIAGYDSGNNDNDPMDDLPSDGNLSFGGHGTHVAGIIGAIANNQTQVSGVMWNCKIMPVKMVGNGSFTFTYPFGSTNWDFSTTAFPSDVADAIDYAVNNGAHVINLSYGFDDMGALLNDVILRVPLLHNAILNAYNHNVVVVVSMGNEYNRGNPTQYPAAFPEVIAVGSMKNSNPPSKSSFSSTGSHICVSAPGDNILSTIRGGGTGIKSGTSMSAPVVSGLAGLIISQGLDRNFNLTNDDVRHILERTAVDIGTVGFDNETGHGIVNAFTALQLLDEPNVLYHYNSISGTSVKTQTLSQWILLSNRWGLASGTYLDVDQYKVTKHIAFDVPFCSTPQVWMRERESKSLSYANPNSGRPFSMITNITNTGFDLEYVTYYVRYNSIGQTINKWVPEAPASTNVAYTAVGVPNFAALASISGSSLVCPSGATITITSSAAFDSIVWSCGPHLAISSGQNTKSCNFSYAGNGSSWVRARLVSTCGSVTLPQKDVWVGGYSSSNYPITGPSSAACRQYVYYSIPTLEGVTSINWIWPSGWTYVSGQNTTNLTLQTGSTGSSGTVAVQATNSCGASGSYATKYTTVTGTCLYSMLVSPNPATGEANIELLSDSKEALAGGIEWELDIYDSMQSLKEKKTNLNTTKTKVYTSGWKDGVYIVRAKIGDEVITGKLVVKH